MTDLLAVLRWLKSLDHNASQDLQRLPAILLGKNLPQATQAYLLTARPLKKVPSWLLGIFLLLLES
jgi:hypothetical protein